MGIQPSPHGITAAPQSPPAHRAQLQGGAVVQLSETDHPLLQGSGQCVFAYLQQSGWGTNLIKNPLPWSVLTGTGGILGHLASRRLAASCVILANCIFSKIYSPKAQISLFLGLLTFFLLIFFYVFLKKQYVGLALVKFVLPWGGVCQHCWVGLPDFPSEIPAFRHQHFLQHGEGTVLAGAKLAASVVVCPGRVWQDPGWAVGGMGNRECWVMCRSAPCVSSCTMPGAKAPGIFSESINAVKPRGHHMDVSSMCRCQQSFPAGCREKTIL